MKVFIKSLSIFLVIVVVAMCIASCGPNMQEISGNYSESYSYGGDYYHVFLLLNDDGTYMKTALRNGNVYSQSNGSFTIKGNEVILLIPARTDTKYFRKLVDYGVNIYFITGRLHFNDSNSAPFPSCYIELTGKTTKCYWLDRRDGE